MRSLSVLLALALYAILLHQCSARKTLSDNHKELIMLEIEPFSHDDRTKRSPDGSEENTLVRQAPNIPPEYLSLLQQLSPQQHQQQLIQQLVVARDGSKQPAAARYILAQDGRIVQESLGVAALQQQQPQYLQIQQQSQLQQPAAPNRPVLSPELEAFSRAQTRLQQDYHDAPIRAQIAGLTEQRADTLTDSLRQLPPVGPESPAPQIFSQAPNQALVNQQAQLQAQLQDPTFGQLQLQAGPNAYFPQISQQQFTQQQLTPLSVASADTGRQLTPVYEQAPRQRVVYQAAQPQSQPQAQSPYTPKLPATSNRRPIGVSAQAQLAPSTQPQLLQASPQAQQLLPQDIPQQYLLETTRSAPAPTSAVRYIDPLSQQEQPSPQNEALFSSLFSSPGRGLFSPATPEKPSKSSIFVSRAGAKTATVSEEQTPTVRIPTPPNQRPLTRAELDALVNAGFSITPVGSEEPQASLLKAKRAPLPLERRNHVIYQNQQDGVSYQYSPGSSDYTPTPKSKRYAPLYELNRSHITSSGSSITYLLALQNSSV